MKRNQYTAIGKDTPEVCIILWEAIARREATKIKRRRKWQWLKNQTKRMLSVLFPIHKVGIFGLFPANKQKTVFEWTETGYQERKEEA